MALQILAALEVLALAALLPLLAAALGRRLLGGRPAPAESAALGLAAISMVVYGLAWAGNMSALNLKLLTLALAILLWREMAGLLAGLIAGARRLWAGLDRPEGALPQRTGLSQAGLQQTGHPMGGHPLGAPPQGAPLLLRALLLLLVGLEMMRLFRCLLPALGWDALGYHLTLADAYLTRGALDPPPWYFPADRRVSPAGVLLKAWLMAFDSEGRVVTVMNGALHAVLIAEIASLAALLLPLRLALLVAAAYAALPEAAVHAAGAGDEMLLSLILLAGLRRVLKPATLLVSKRMAPLLGLLLGFALAIKMTTVFWMLPLVPLLLWRQRRRPLRGLLFLALLALVAGGYHGHSYSRYGAVFPFERHANLLYSGQPGQPRVLAGEEIRAERKTLGLERDFNEVDILDNWRSRTWSNLRALPRVPAGPFLLWLLPFFFLRPASPRSWRRAALAGLGFAAFVLLASAAAWHFTPPAFFRYHLPTWAVLVAAAMVGVAGWCHQRGWESTLVLPLSALLMVAFFLEGRQIAALTLDRPVLDPARYRQRYVADGPLALRLTALKKPGEAVFYIGPASFLFRGPRVFPAQLGNEAGWRRISDIESFLVQEHIQWWVTSAACSKLDPAYEALTDYFLQHGWLSLVEKLPAGQIFRVLPSASPTARPAPL